MMFNGSSFNASEFNGDSANTFGYAYEKVLSDALSMYDSDGVVRIQERLTGDVLTAVDQVIAQTFGGPAISTRTASDAVPVTDAGLRFRALTRIFSDGFAVADETYRAVARYRIALDVLSLFDNGPALRIQERLVGDLASLVDSKSVAGQSSISIRTVTDNVVVDDAGRNVAIDVLQDDTIALSDGALRTVLRIRTVQDLLLLVDSLSKTVYNGSGSIYSNILSDALTVYDTDGVRRLQERLASDAARLLDAANAAGSAPTVSTRTASDAIVVDDSGRTLEVDVLGDDSIALTDSASRLMQRYRLTQDLLSIVDQLSKSVTGTGASYTSTLSDALIVSDSAFRALLRMRIGSDGFALADSVAHSLQRVRITLDTVDIGDGSLQYRMLRRLVTETLGITDDASGLRVPYIRYAYDPRPVFGAEPSGIIFGAVDPIVLGADNSIIFGGYN